MKNLDKMIEIKCDCDKVIDFHELTEFQGGLKERTQADYDKAKKSILKYGWSFVLYYWNDGKTKWIIDGHNRVTVLKQLEKDGYFIPPIPAIEVFCKDRKEAKEKLLRLNSTFGKLTKESVLEFAEDIDLNFDEIALPDTTIDFSGEEAGSEEKEKPDIEFNESYSVVVQCINEEECEEVFNKLTSEGYKCKVSTL